MEALLQRIDETGDAALLRPALEEFYRRGQGLGQGAAEGEAWEELNRLVEIDREKETVMLAFHDGKN